ncbi:MMPL family transporter [Clostridium oryzae]|nr:MMPL family transporter [Clostridium oryzae]
MRKIIKARWALLIVWLVAAILLTAFQPNVNAILENKGQEALSADSKSVIADSIIKKMDKTKGSDDIIIFYNKSKITDSQMETIEDGVKALTDDKKELGINKMIDPFSMPDAKSSLISKDKTTLMVSFKLDKKDRKVPEIKKQFDKRLKNVGIKYYLSGSDFINYDYQTKSEAGVEKSAALTVIFILGVLMLMFRSIVTPLISLVAVAFSYMTSMGIAAQLIDKAGFPVTSLTQMLLILILFGIGTDYNILLFNRFKEELSNGHTIDDAIVRTYKTAGKTIAFSILTVFIAFLSLALAESPIYQSGVVVVIGVSMLLLEILTLTPFAMKTLGYKIFWPSKKASGHGENKLWGTVSAVSTKHPIISVLLVLVIIAPTIYFHQTKLDFDTVKELGNKAPSSKGFNLIADHFGGGQAMPTSVVIKSKKPMDSNAYYRIIDELTERLKTIKGVKKVSSLTQPEAKQIKGFYTNSQTKSVAEGLSKTQDGVDKINDGLKLASDKLGSADFSKVSKMVDGTGKLQNGVGAMADGLKQIQNGIGNGSKGSQSISSGLATIQVNLGKVSGGLKELSTNYNKMQSGYSKMGSSYQDIAKALLGVKSALSQMQPMVDALGKSYSNSQSDRNYLALKATIDKLSKSLGQVTPEGINTLNKNYNALTGGFGKANVGLTKMSTGVAQMSEGLKKLESGLTKTSSGIGTIATNMNKVSTGLGQMKSGQQKLVDGLNGFSTFGKKLGAVNNGLKQISNGLGKTNDFLYQLNSSKTLFIPKEALESKDFKKVFKNFMTKNKKITKLSVILKYDPYSNDATKVVEEINKTVASTLKGTALSGSKFGASGPSATADDMNNVLSRDLSRTSVIVLIGVLLVLILVTRSLWEPICITASLMGAYYAAMFILNVAFININGLEGISSFVPFFSFIIIVALGVDYSIFVMMRYKEYPDLSPREAIIESCKHIGSVVMSAVLILGGTFATLIPSGMILLIELATAVISGLVVLCLILLPIFLPAMIAVPDYIKKLTLKKDKNLDYKEKTA